MKLLWPIGLWIPFATRDSDGVSVCAEIDGGREGSRAEDRDPKLSADVYGRACRWIYLDS